MSPVRVVFNAAKVLAEVDALVTVLVAKIAKDIEAWAKVHAPIDTGFLRGSIRAEAESSHSWRVIVGAEYGAYVELGTVNMEAQPYLMPAVEMVRSKLEGAAVFGPAVP